jgi:hypothetical protein
MPILRYTRAAGSAVGTPADSTAPTLSSFTAVPGADDRWGELSVDTDEDNGTIYWIVQAAATATPSAAQVIAGQDGAGAAATFAGSSSVTATGTYTKRATGLTGGTAYEACVVHRDAALNVSSVGSALFSTDTLVMSRVTDGLSTGLSGATGFGSFTTSQGDPDGGTNAVSYVDNNDAGTGSFSLNTTSFNFFSGVNRFRVKMKCSTSAAAAMWIRIRPINTSIVSATFFDITNGAVGTEAWIGTPTITSLGSGWFQIDGSLDMTGADVNGALNFDAGDANGDTSVVRNGTNVNLMYDLRVTRAT